MTDLTTEPRKGERLAYLDNLKWMLIAGIIASHAIMGYADFGSWTYQEAREVTLSGATEILFVIATMVFGALFMMALFFLMSGLVAQDSLSRKGPGRFARDRLLRLGIPFAVYTLVVWPLLEYTIQGGIVHRGFWDSYTDPHPVLDSGPMWFVGILFLFSLVLAGWRRFRAVPIPADPDRTEPRGRDLALLAVAVGLATFAIRIVMPADSNQPLNSHVWAWPEYIAMFGLGVVASRRGWLRPVSLGLRRRCGFAALIGVLCAATSVATSEPLGLTEDAYFGGWGIPAFIAAMTEGVVAVTASIWVLAVAQRHFNGTGSLRKAMARGSYLAFMLQGPVLVALALILRPVDLPAEAKAFLVASLGIAGSFGLAYPLVTRTRLGRVL